MSDESNIIRLASVNNDVRTEGKAASELVVAFLREWADAVEKGEYEAERAILIFYDRKDMDGECFRIRSRRCNVDLIGQVGMVQLALVDLCTVTTED